MGAGKPSSAVVPAHRPRERLPRETQLSWMLGTHLQSVRQPLVGRLWDRPYSPALPRGPVGTCSLAGGDPARLQPRESNPADRSGRTTARDHPAAA